MQEWNHWTLLHWYGRGRRREHWRRFHSAELRTSVETEEQSGRLWLVFSKSCDERDTTYIATLFFWRGLAAEELAAMRSMEGTTAEVNTRLDTLALKWDKLAGCLSKSGWKNVGLWLRKLSFSCLLVCGGWQVQNKLLWCIDCFYYLHWTIFLFHYDFT